jgi:PAS domain S-box-containing protein
MESGNPDGMSSSTSGAFAASYLAAIVESSEDAILSKNLDGIIQSTNAAAEKLFGYSPDELIGQSVRILIPPDRQEEEDYILGKISGGERVDHFETVRVAKDGHLVDISLTVSPVRNASGAIIGVSKIARDITDRKRAAAALAAQQEALAEQREWFETTLESIGDAVIATDVRGRVVFMNPIAEHLTGWRMENARERACTEVFSIINESTRRSRIP